VHNVDDDAYFCGKFFILNTELLILQYRSNIPINAVSLLPVLFSVLVQY